MSDCTKRNEEFLRQLKTKKIEKRQELINSASLDNLTALSEIAHNTLKGNIPLKEHQKRKLKKEREFVRQLANTKISKKKKRVLLVLNSKIIPFLITPFLSAIGTISGKLICSSLNL